MGRLALNSILIMLLLVVGWSCARKPQIIRVKYLGYSSFDRPALTQLAELKPPLGPEIKGFFDRAVWHYQRQEYDSAGFALDEALELSPTEWRLYFMRGVITGKIDSSDISHRYFLTALGFAPDDSKIRSQIYLAIAEDMERRRDFGRAKQNYLTALNLDPACTRARDGMQRLTQLSAAEEP
ncbi:MAG: hypothetical protein JSW34_06875 [Candidatus Zixiibacteriota bacterium]|nr:MAG: hypothetical protein JSW34_06875 [candidate division Zixibacteria bacterium]